MSMHNGAYLIIEHTEAMHVIDVNSGGRVKTGDATQESNALQVNLDALQNLPVSCASRYGWNHCR